MKTIFSLTLAAAAVVAGLSFTTASSVHAACATPLEDPRPAFNPNGQRIGEVIASFQGDDGEATAYVVQRPGFMYGYSGRSQVLPAEFVSFLAGRAKVKVTDPSEVDGFPAYSC